MPFEVTQRISDYCFFGTRLDELREAYTEIEATTWKQKFFDHRSGNRWFETWIAVIAILVMTFVFGVISTVTGILQVQIAAKSIPSTGSTR